MPSRSSSAPTGGGYNTEWAPSPEQGTADSANAAARMHQNLMNQYLGNSGGGKKKKRRGGGGGPPPTPPVSSGGGGGGGGGGPRPPKVDALGSENPMSMSIQDHIAGILSGQKTRWTPERMNMAKDSLFESTVGQTRAQIKQMDASLARRGLMRSGVAARAEKDLRTEGIKAYSKGVRELIMKKMDDEFNDKMKAMDTAVNWLNSERNYALGKERNQIAREQIAAQMAAARLSAQVQREGIRAANGRAAAALGFQREQAASQNAWNAMSWGSRGVAGPGGEFVYGNVPGM